MTSAFFSTGIFLASPGSKASKLSSINTTENIQASDTKIHMTYQGIPTIQSWWNAQWTYRQLVNFTEPGLMDRLNDPENVYMTFATGIAHNNSIRLALFNSSTSSWNEIPSQVWNATFYASTSFYSSCTIFFFLNMTKGTTDTYYVYYDPVINTKTTYVNHIYLRGYNDTAITADTTNPSFKSFYYNNNTKPTYSHINSIQIIVNNNTAVPRAKICLVPTVRAGSDWGGPSQSIYSAIQGSTDALSLANKDWESVGELALQAANDTNVDGSGALEWERLNVGPDNPAEAWDGHGKITVLANGPLFCQFKIQTTDGAYNNAVPTTTTWINGGYIDAWNASVVADTVNRGNDGYTSPGGSQVCNVGGVGYTKYNITYSVYYQQATSSQMFSRIDLSIGAFPQRGTAASHYYAANARYTYNTGVCFKNYGDWPHIVQIVATNTSTLAQNSKSWNGSKYGLYTMGLSARKCDYPLEPWTCWWDSNNVAPTIGLMAVTNSIGWQVLSLAVTGIGPNSLLQQILPEGLQGGLYQIPNGVIMSYTYYTMTSPGGSNYTSVRDMSRRLNKPAIVYIANKELFSHNAIFVHVQDHSGQTALGTEVQLWQGVAKLNDTFVNSVGNVTMTRIPDGTYSLFVLFTTGTTTYTAYTTSITLVHATTRYYYRTITASIANLTINLRNKAENNAAIPGAQIRILNSTNNNTILQGLTDQVGNPITFRLYSNVSSGNTPYRIQVYYGGILRVINITQNPYPLSGNTVLNLGVAIDTTTITIQSSDLYVNFGATYSLTFTYHKSSDVNIKYLPSQVNVSTNYQSGFWRNGTDYIWSKNSSTGVVSMQLFSGALLKLNHTGVFGIYLYASNNTVEQAILQEFIVVNALATKVEVFFNGANVTSSTNGNFNYTQVITIRVRYYTTNPIGNLTTGNSTSIKLTDGKTVWTNCTNTTIPYYIFTLNSSYFNPQSSYTFKITCTSPTTSTQIFALTIFPRNIQTSLKTSSFTTMTPQLGHNPTITANWTNVVTIYVQFHDDLNKKYISTSTAGLSVYALIGMSIVNATTSNGTEWRIDIDTQTAPLVVGGTTLIAIRSTAPGVYQLAEFLFNLYTKPIATTADYLVNGKNQTKLATTTFQLGSSIQIIATERTWTGSIVSVSTVSISYYNATNPAQATIVKNATTMINGSYYIPVLLDTNTFYAQNQFFYLQIEKTNYTSIVLTIPVRVNPIPVIVSVFSNGASTGSDTMPPTNINDNFNFTISLNATNYSSKFLKSVKYLRVTLNVPYLEQTFNMSTSGNGIYWIMLSAPGYADKFSVTVQIYVPQNQSAIQLQYDIKTTYTFYIQTVVPTNSGIPVWVFWLVFGGLVAMAAWFILYQVRFKYPPLVRKIHDLKRSVARGRIASRIPKQKVKTREENIFQVYAKQINEYGFLQTRDSRYAARAAGYAPIPDQSISLEFEMPAIDKAEIEALEFQAPKVSGKAPTKQYIALEAPAAPAPAPSIPRPLTKPAPLKPGARPVAPIKPVKPAGMKPQAKPSIKALPKPAAPLPKVAVASALPSPAVGAETTKPENLYQDLVLLEQKRYKAERSLRDLDAKHSRGTISDEEYEEYGVKIKESLDKLKENIAQLRRKMLSF